MTIKSQDNPIGTFRTDEVNKKKTTTDKRIVFKQKLMKKNTGITTGSPRSRKTGKKCQIKKKLDRSM